MARKEERQAYGNPEPPDQVTNYEQPTDEETNADDVAAETANDGSLEDAAAADMESLADEEINGEVRNPFHYGF